MNTFGWLYLIFWAALIIVEIVGATTSYVPLDTMSEYYFKFQESYPILARVILSVGLAILWAHLALKPGTIK